MSGKDDDAKRFGGGADTERDLDPYEDLFETNGVKLVATAVGIDTENWKSLRVDTSVAQRAAFQRDEAACKELIRLARAEWGVPRIVYIWGDSGGWLLANPGYESVPPPGIVN
jgi:hypothetical protein